MKIPARILQGLKAGVTTTTLAFAVAGCSTDKADPEVSADREAVAEANDASDVDDEADSDQADRDQGSDDPADEVEAGIESAPVDRDRREVTQNGSPVSSPFLQGSEPAPAQIASDPPPTQPVGAVDGPPKVGGTAPLPPQPIAPITQPIERPPHWAAACGRG